MEEQDVAMGSTRPSRGSSTTRMLGGVAVGAAVGAGAYLLLGPVLEDASGWVRELQGLSWNLVPGLAVVGGVLGARWHRHAPR